MADVRKRGPNFLTVDDPLIAIEVSFGLHVGKIATGVGFAVTLTPAFFATQDSGQEQIALFARAVFDDRRREQIFAHVVRSSGSLGSHILFSPDDLLINIGTASAVLGRPT